MTDFQNCTTQSIPAYSGITINITNPTLNAAPLNGRCTPPQNRPDFMPQRTITVERTPDYNQPYYINNNPNQYITNPDGTNTAYENAQIQTPDKRDNLMQSYPPQYYINNYNNQYQKPVSASENTPEKQDTAAMVNQAGQQAQPLKESDNNRDDNNNIINNNTVNNNSNNDIPVSSDGTAVPNHTAAQDNLNQTATAPDEQKSLGDNYEYTPSEKQVIPGEQETKEAEEDNLTTSKEIIETLDEKAEEQRELEKNSKKQKVVALTNEYIMSLENYLNNPNSEIRLMAAKEVITRLDEDKSRYDDAALNALLNKMLQDPAKLVRTAALSALSANLASGNDYTVELLNRIQQDANADQQDVIDAAHILLNMSATTDIRYVPVRNTEAEGEQQ